MTQGMDSDDVDESTTSNPWGPITGYPMNSATPSTAVVEAVAAATDRDPLDMPVLQDAIDADALDALLDGNNSASLSPVHVEFDYAGVSVVVDSDDGVSIRMGAPDREAAE